MTPQPLLPHNDCAAVYHGVRYAANRSVNHSDASLTNFQDNCYCEGGEGRRLSPRTSTEKGRRSGVALAGAIGGYAALCILAGLVVGFLLDRLLHTAPWFLIGGVVVGFIVSFYLTYRLAMGELGD